MGIHEEIRLTMGQRRFGCRHNPPIVVALSAILTMLRARTLHPEGHSPQFDREIRRDLLELLSYPELAKHCSFQNTITLETDLGFDPDAAYDDVEQLADRYNLTGFDFYEIGESERRNRAEKERENTEI